MSGLDDLTREELKALVLKLHETVQIQQREIAELKAIVAKQSKRIRELEAEVARLRGGRPPLDFCIKPSVPKKEKGPRKRRKQSFARVSFVATKVVLYGVAVGKKRVGIRLMSVIVHLKTVCRVPIGQIKKLIWTLWGLKISAGEIAEILHDVAQFGESIYDDLLGSVRGSPVVCADETGWREDGINGYIWSFSTPDVRYYTYRHSRGALVAKEVLSKSFVGALVSDFYAAYNFYDGVK